MSSSPRASASGEAHTASGAAVLRRGRHRHARARCSPAALPRGRPEPRSLCRQRRNVPLAPDAAARFNLASRGGSPASRCRASSASASSMGAPSRIDAPHARPAGRYRDADRGGALRLSGAAGAAVAEAARSRHRQRLHPDHAAGRVAAREGSASTSASPALEACAGQCRHALASGPARRFIAGDWLDAHRRRFRSCRRQSALSCLSGDIAGLLRRSAPTTPRLALDGGTDGLDAYRRIAAAPRRSWPRGICCWSRSAHGQAEAVSGLSRRPGGQTRLVRAIGATWPDARAWSLAALARRA